MECVEIRCQIRRAGPSVFDVAIVRVRVCGRASCVMTVHATHVYLGTLQHPWIVTVQPMLYAVEPVLVGVTKSDPVPHNSE